MQVINILKAEDYQWSSCRAHLNLVEDSLVKAKVG